MFLLFTQFVSMIMMQIKQQKDIFGRQCCLFLSNYISVYSGYGPKRSGIRRLYITFLVYSFLFSGCMFTLFKCTDTFKFFLLPIF